MLATQLRYDLLMFSREVFYLIFTILVPPVAYIFMGQLVGDRTYIDGLGYAETYTPSFILFITFSVVFFAFGFDKVMNRTTGVEKRIKISPVPERTLLLSAILKSVIITSCGFLLIHSIGIFLYGLPFKPAAYLVSYVFFILLNAVLLLLSSAVYALFNDMRSALVFSILTFQVVLFTGDFSVPVSLMPPIIQTIAMFNPLYHMNHLFIDVWNQQFRFDTDTWQALVVIAFVVSISIIILRVMRRKQD